MSQLFTVYFPKYCFELQEEFCITFPDADKLPFEADVSDKGVPYVKAVTYGSTQHSSHNIKQWAASGLKVGLRIASINDEILCTEQQNGMMTGSDHNILSRKDLLSRIHQYGSSSITFAFREDIPCFDDSEALGLSWKEAVIDNDNDIKEEIKEEYKLNDDAICVSSFKETDNDCNAPQNVRLNNPNGYWSPSNADTRCRNAWISFDLGSKKVVDIIKIQGNHDHSAYVTSLWIEYSQDMCCWKSHPMGRIQCHYINDQEEYEEYTATIKLWPIINAQFIRVRPWKWMHHIALRMELFGHDRASDEQQNEQIGKLVTLNTVCPQFKEQLDEVLVNKDPDTNAIQIDCRAIITKAMDLAGSTSYGIIDVDNTHCLLMLSTPHAALSERVMDSLTNIGVGRQFGVISSINVEWRNAAHNIEKSEPLDVEAASTGFAASVKSHRKVQVIVERIMNSAALTFDYYCMLTVASMIAVGGLATNSAVIVVASMLVSPIMGPVLAFTFGVTLSNWPLARLGVRNECISLLLCLLIGFIVGFFYAWGTKNRNDWPTEEMASRGDPWVLTDGAFIAAASGVGVALSVLGDYLSTVVGVAISASLLPPAVNCGMLLSFCIYEAMLPECVQYPGCGDIQSIHDYSASETTVSAIISLILTIENIIIIFISAWIMFRVKDIVLTKDRNQKLWDYISQFKAQHRNVRKMKRQMPTDIESEGDSGAHGNFEFDVCTQAGTRAEKALGQVKTAIKHQENDIIHSTLKGELFKRHISTFYVHETTPLDESNSCFSLGDQAKDKSNQRPHLDTIFSGQKGSTGKTTESAPLMGNDIDDKVEGAVVDDNDP